MICRAFLGRSLQRSKMTSCTQNIITTEYELNIDAWAARMTEGRDVSHAIEHFRRVKNYTSQIMQGLEPELNNIHDVDCRKVLVAAALLHDVFDHKYASAEETSDGLNEMCSFLRNEQKFTQIEVEAVISICTNVSYSKEKKGLLEKLDYPISLLRDIVSDADKLDAIGLAGIERCRLYSKV